MIGAIVIPLVENDETIYVADYGNSAWWTFATLTTGGFADLHDPISVVGRWFTAFLIIVGWVLVGIFTATLTNVYRGEDSDDLRYGQEKLSSEITELSNLRDELQGELSQMRKALQEANSRK